MSDTALRLDLPATIAHRGLSALAPENTLAAVRAAHAAGHHWVELDVQLLGDGTPVIWHDAGVRRCSNGRGKLNQLTWDSASRLDVGRWFDRAFSDERMATLDAMLALLAELGMGLNLEMKVNRGRDVDALVERVLPDAMQALPAERLLVSSFDMTALNAVRRLAPDPQHLALGLLYKKLPRDWEDNAARLEAFSLHLDWQRLKLTQAQEVAASPYRLLCYTVNDAKAYRRLCEWGVDAVISDDPGQLTR
ncbi:glycerophosphoryl diester phosphodiesterase [Modicisalibacter luteus]|nr:glycerophosphodiester phosphodiesterase family protein [Halomonas lutea]GHA89800.1 glycerophosphoryl diester phosphodiesterase [Halomonas lutea]